MSDNHEGARLPPPAFPPGQRRRAVSSSRPPSDGSAAGSATGVGVGGAFISPDEPIPPRHDAVEGAFISPDDPLPARHYPEVADEVEGVVTGMSFDPHLDPGEVVAGGDPHVLTLVESVEKLAEDLKRRGEAGLRTTPEMSRFEATLRAYCVGFLAGKRAEEPALPPPDPYPEI